tara:strand:- start:350 stop:568 length:219 start_codon:yes stop_codon:yes gene_type:complete
MSNLLEDRSFVLSKLRILIQANIPKDFSEEISYGMIGNEVPHSACPLGDHCNTKLPLPFLSIASQNNFILPY